MNNSKSLFCRILKVLLLSSVPFLLSSSRIADHTTLGVANPKPPADGIEIISASRTRLVGKFRKGKLGVFFVSNKEGKNIYLKIRTMPGKREILSITNTETEYILKITAINGRSLKARIGQKVVNELEQEPVHMRITREHAADIATTFKDNTKIDGTYSVIQSLKQTPEYALLPSISFELNKLGLTGNKYAPAFAIHAVALRAASELGIDPRNPGVVYRYKLPPDIAGRTDLQAKLAREGALGCWNVEDGPNREGLPPCPKPCDDHPNRENDCYGMCGPGCSTCWDWVCGDCCYHQFCATHDSQLRACDGAFDLAFCINAILPWYFVVIGCD